MAFGPSVFVIPVRNVVRLDTWRHPDNWTVRSFALDGTRNCAVPRAAGEPKPVIFAKIFSDSLVFGCQIDFYMTLKHGGDVE
jgi:hypothetical protein